MTSERKLKPDESQTWGEYTNLEESEEKEGMGLEWFTAGHIATLSLSDEGPIESLHNCLDSFNKTVMDSRDRLVRFVVVPSRTHTEPGDRDWNEVIVKIEPDDDSVTVDGLKNFTDKVKNNL